MPSYTDMLKDFDKHCKMPDDIGERLTLQQSLVDEEYGEQSDAWSDLYFAYEDWEPEDKAGDIKSLSV